MNGLTSARAVWFDDVGRLQVQVQLQELAAVMLMLLAGRLVVVVVVVVVSVWSVCYALDWGSGASGTARKKLLRDGASS